MPEMIDCFVATLARGSDYVKPGEHSYPKMDKELGARLLKILDQHPEVGYRLIHQDYDGDLIGVTFFAPDSDAFIKIVREAFGNDLDFGKSNEDVIVAQRPDALFVNWTAIVRSVYGLRQRL